MKKNIKIDVIKLFIWLFVSANLIISPIYANDEISEELLETKQQGEIVLNLEDENSQEPESSSLVETDEAVDNTEFDFELFKIFDSEKTISEDSAFGKILHSKITRTDIPQFLLQEDLTFEFEKGPIKKIQPFFAYNGSLNSLWLNSDYSTKYNNNFKQFGIFGSLKNPDYKFQITLNPIPVRGENYIENFIADAFIVNTSIPHHQFIIGNSRIQKGVEGGSSAYILPFITRSQIARNFGNTRALAVKLIGNYQYFDYNISAGSSGRSIINGIPGAEFNSWINYKPLGDKKSKKYGKVTIGAGYNGGHNRFDYNVLSTYLSYHHKKLWTNFEAAIANGYNGAAALSQNKANGYAFTAGWKFNPHLQLIGRIDQFDPNRHQAKDSKQEYTLGLNWFIKGQALKFVINYVFCNSQNTKDSHKLIIGTQILL